MNTDYIQYNDDLNDQLPIPLGYNGLNLKQQPEELHHHLPLHAHLQEMESYDDQQQSSTTAYHQEVVKSVIQPSVIIDNRCNVNNLHHHQEQIYYHHHRQPEEVHQAIKSISTMTTIMTAMGNSYSSESSSISNDGTSSSIDSDKLLSVPMNRSQNVTHDDPENGDELHETTTIGQSRPLSLNHRASNSSMSTSTSTTVLAAPQSASSLNRTLIKQQHKQLNDLTLGWLEQNYEIRDGICLPRCLIYRHYLEFMQTFSPGSKPVGAAAFGKLVRQKFPRISTRRLGTRGQSKYHYYGISIRHNSPFFNDQTSIVYSQNFGGSPSSLQDLRYHQKSTVSPQHIGQPGNNHHNNPDHHHHHLAHHHLAQQPQDEQQQDSNLEYYYYNNHHLHHPIGGNQSIIDHSQILFQQQQQQLMPPSTATIGSIEESFYAAPTQQLVSNVHYNLTNDENAQQSPTECYDLSIKNNSQPSPILMTAQARPMMLMQMHEVDMNNDVYSANPFLPTIANQPITKGNQQVLYHQQQNVLERQNLPTKRSRNRGNLYRTTMSKRGRDQLFAQQSLTDPTSFTNQYSNSNEIQQQTFRKLSDEIEAELDEFCGGQPTQTAFGYFQSNYPTIDQLSQPLPEEVQPQILSTFLLMYQSHCQRLFDTFQLANIDELRRSVLNFWQEMPAHMAPLLASKFVLQVIHLVDTLLYKTVEDFFAQLSLVPEMSETFVQDLKLILMKMNEWLASAIIAQPSRLRQLILEYCLQQKNLHHHYYDHQTNQIIHNQDKMENPLKQDQNNLQTVDANHTHPRIDPRIQMIQDRVDQHLSTLLTIKTDAFDDFSKAIGKQFKFIDMVKDCRKRINQFLKPSIASSNQNQMSIDMQSLNNYWLDPNQNPLPSMELLAAAHQWPQEDHPFTASMINDSDDGDEEDCDIDQNHHLKPSCRCLPAEKMLEQVHQQFKLLIKFMQFAKNFCLVKILHWTRAMVDKNILKCHWKCMKQRSKILLYGINFYITNVMRDLTINECKSIIIWNMVFLCIKEYLLLYLARLDRYETKMLMLPTINSNDFKSSNNSNLPPHHHCNEDIGNDDDGQSGCKLVKIESISPDPPGTLEMRLSTSDVALVDCTINPSVQYWYPPMDDNNQYVPTESTSIKQGECQTIISSGSNNNNLNPGPVPTTYIVEVEQQRQQEPDEARLVVNNAHHHQQQQPYRPNPTPISYAAANGNIYACLT